MSARGLDRPGNGYASVHLGSDGDCRSVAVTLIRLEDDQIPANWWERQVPRVSLGLREVAEKLAPQSLSGESALPPIEREADRASHLQFGSRHQADVQAPVAACGGGGARLARLGALRPVRMWLARQVHGG